MSKIYLVRHGETLWNSTMRYQGSSDIELSDEGINQAKKLSEKLKTVDFDAAYSSDLKRAFVTCQTVIGERDVEIVQKPALREMSFGLWEGLTHEQIEAKNPGEMDKFFTDPANCLIPQGENFAILQERVYPCFEEIINDNHNKNILIVAHGGTIRAILAKLLSMDLKAVWFLQQYNTSVNIISKQQIKGNERIFVELINDISHL